MEVVTPFGWVPTPVGRAGRRASKRPVQFTPSTEVTDGTGRAGCCGHGERGGDGVVRDETFVSR